MRVASRRLLQQIQRSSVLAFAVYLAMGAPTAIEVCADVYAIGGFQAANLQRDAEEVAEVAGRVESKVLLQYTSERSRRATLKSGS